MSLSEGTLLWDIQPNAASLGQPSGNTQILGVLLQVESTITIVLMKT